MPFRRPLLVVLCFFAVLSLGLLIGGVRLWDTDEPKEPALVSESRAPVPFFFLCGAVEARRGDALSFLDVTGRDARRIMGPETLKAVSPLGSDSWPVRDANGNVLRKVRYIKAVYCAFSFENAGG
ncbi:MAG: hypothetical protein FWD51_07130 [Betaproteobacteria bacterium]|nr:hypothetical protein [Betaproteobacteria bacterium]